MLTKGPVGTLGAAPLFAAGALDLAELEEGAVVWEEDDVVEGFEELFVDVVAVCLGMVLGIVVVDLW